MEPIEKEHFKLLQAAREFVTYLNKPPDGSGQFVRIQIYTDENSLICLSSVDLHPDEKFKFKGKYPV